MLPHQSGFDPMVSIGSARGETLPQTTESHRIERIRELLAEANKIPPSKRPEGERLPAIGSGDGEVCPVITIGVDEVVLNPDSHRIKAQLQDDPEWEDLKNQPYSEQAQNLIRRHVREARKENDFAELKNSIASEGQDFPGVITHMGVLVNANTRAVAIGEFEDPTKRFIRVAVLPETVQPRELALLELRLQMRKELKEPYTLTNELLFIDELSARGLTDKQIARELRIYPDNEAKGEKEVQTRLRLLDLIHQLQRIPSVPPSLGFFDTLGYEQLRELLRDQDALMQTDPDEAERLMASFLLSTAVGVTPVHRLRKIDPSFMDEYMYPQLEEDEELGRFAEILAIGDEEPMVTSRSSNVLDLPTASSDGETGEINIKRLVNAVTGPGKELKIPGTAFTIQRSSLREGIKAAILTGIKEKQRDKKDENKLEAPLTAVKTATKQLVGAADAVKEVVNDPDFDQSRKRSLEAAFKKLRKRQRELENILTELEILS
jgi:hypothetical protein